MQILSAHLLALRQERKLTRQMVADSIGISPRTYQRYENAEREPTLSVLVLLADFYGVSMDYLAGRTDRREVNR